MQPILDSRSVFEADSMAARVPVLRHPLALPSLELYQDKLKYKLKDELKHLRTVEFTSSGLSDLPSYGDVLTDMLTPAVTYLPPAEAYEFQALGHLPEDELKALHHHASYVLNKGHRADKGLQPASQRASSRRQSTVS